MATSHRAEKLFTETDSSRGEVAVAGLGRIAFPTVDIYKQQHASNYLLRFRVVLKPIKHVMVQAFVAIADLAVTVHFRIEQLYQQMYIASFAALATLIPD